MNSRILPSTNRTLQIRLDPSTEELNNLVDSRNRPLIIILAITLPTLVLIGIIILIIICYRRRHATIWLKKIEHSSRLQAIVVNISSTPIQPDYSEKKPSLVYRHIPQPHTETIVYNRLSTPPTPVFIKPDNPIKTPIRGETNAAFDGCLIKNEQQLVLRSTLQQSSNNGQRITSLHTDFPTSLQAPVRTITSALVDAIAAHRLSLHVNENHTSSTSSLETTTNRHSAASSLLSNTSQTVLLFSQRTQL
ncbi:unnamed protein product [Adineta ricciae]|uniref:Uncharacterized protein n=1 Tax=Adineta ricciae TaxID=249248 RepID=A0A815KVF2_ADIRI|nr:unnamed protein product [Adineta ricciae]